MNYVISESISSSAYWDQFQTNTQLQGSKASKDWFLTSLNAHQADKQFLKSQGFTGHLSRRSQTASVLSEVEENPFSNFKSKGEDLEKLLVEVNHLNSEERPKLKPINVDLVTSNPIRIEGIPGNRS